MAVELKISAFKNAMCATLTPFLTEKGFEPVPAKDGWTWFCAKGKAMNILHIYRPEVREAYKNRNKIIRIEQGVYYRLEGDRGASKNDADRERTPAISICQLREPIASGKKDERFSFASGGENLSRVLINIRNILARKGMEWFEKASGRETVFDLIDERAMDAHYTIKRYCFSLGLELAKKFEDGDRAEKYKSLLSELSEALRAQSEKPLDPADEFWESFYG